MIIFCQASNYILYLKYVGTQMNQIICQETDNQFCAGSSNTFLLYYYIPVSIVVLFIAQLKSYKQISYIAKIAMVATIIAILAILIDSVLQILIYLRIEYTSSQTMDGNQEVRESNIQIFYEHTDQSSNISIF